MKKYLSVAGIVVLVALSISTAFAENGDRAYKCDKAPSTQICSSVGTGNHSVSGS